MSLKHVMLSLGLFVIGFTGLQAQQTTDIMAVAEANQDLEMLVSAINTADLSTTLKAKGPFTIFAPSNQAFNKLPDEKLDKLLMSENKQLLQQVLTYHVLDKAYDAKSILSAIQQGQGKAVFTTVHGAKLTAKLKDGKIILEDELGNQSHLTASDVKASNGIIHFVDSLMLPMSIKKPNGGVF